MSKNSTLIIIVKTFIVFEFVMTSNFVFLLTNLSIPFKLDALILGYSGGKKVRIKTEKAVG